MDGAAPDHDHAGKQLSGKPSGGDRWLRGVLGEVAWVIARSKGTYLHAQFHRIARKRGTYKAVVAVMHSVLVIAYHVLKTGPPYAELGADYFERREAERLERHHVRRRNALGYSVTLTPLASPEPVPA